MQFGGRNQLDDVNIFGVRIDTIGEGELKEAMKDAIQNGHFLSIITLNPEFLLMARNNEEAQHILANADYCIVDGVGIQYAAIALNNTFVQRITGVDLVKVAAGIAEEQSRPTLIIGTESEQIMKQACDSLREQINGREITGIVPPKIANNVQTKVPQNILDQVQNINPCAILIALPMKLQLAFIHQLKHIGWEGVIIGVGGAIDMYSGSIKRAPQWMQNNGLEWAWRLLQEPRRIKRIIRAVFIFPLHVILLTLNRRIFTKACIRVGRSILTIPYEKN